MPLPFPNGKPSIEWIADTAKRSSTIDTIVIASSDREENDILENFCRKKSISLFRGSEDNVLQRFADVIRLYAFDVVIRLTGDNPIIDIDVIDQVVNEHVLNKNDYTSSSGLPLGMNVEIVSADVLLHLQNKYRLGPSDKEHVTLFVKNSPEFRKQNVAFYKNEELDNLRLTIDYPSDFSTLSLILSSLQPGELPGLGLIRRLKKDHGWIFTSNINNIQRQP